MSETPRTDALIASLSPSLRTVSTLSEIQLAHICACLEIELAVANKALEHYSRLESEAGGTLGDRLDMWEELAAANARIAELEKTIRAFAE